MANATIASSSLIVFTRYPKAGQTKTRLIPALGAAGAATLQRHMTEYLIGKLQPFCQAQSLCLNVHFAGGSQSQMLAWLGPGIALTPQCAGSLGEKLIYAMAQAFAAGRQQVIAIGSDCPAISSQEIGQALSFLPSCDVVLGPAVDGGYYLIALKAMHPCLFQDIPWGTHQVLETTKAIADKHGLSVALLPVLTDIDRPADLPLWTALRSAESQSSLPLSTFETADSSSSSPQIEL